MIQMLVIMMIVVMDLQILMNLDACGNDNDDHDHDQDDCDGGFIYCDEIGLLTSRHRQRRSFGQDTRWKRRS